MLEENKELVRRLYEECWNKGKIDTVKDLVSADCRLHDPVFPSLTPGAESLRQHIQMCRTSFPDLQFNINDTIAERDEVVVHWTARGTQKAQFLGLQPTNRSASVSGTSIYRIRNNKIVEQFADWNLLTMLDQLGIATEPKLKMATSR